MDVLIVEDDPVQAEIVDQVLSEAGWTARIAGTVAQAKELFHEVEPTVALLDYRLPDDDGLVLLDWIRQQDASVPVVFLTGEGSEEIALQALGRGAIDYIVKSPSAYKDLPHRLKVAVARWEEVEEALVNQLQPGEQARPAGAEARDQLNDRFAGFTENPAIEGVLISDLQGRTVFSDLPDQTDLDRLKARVAALAHQGRKTGEAAEAGPYRHTMVIQGTDRVIITAPGPNATLVTVLLRPGTGLWSAVQYLARASNLVREAFEAEN